MRPQIIIANVYRNPGLDEEVEDKKETVKETKTGRSVRTLMIVGAAPHHRMLGREAGRMASSQHAPDATRCNTA